MTAQNSKPDIERALRDENARHQPLRCLPPLAAIKREFQKLDEDRYRLTVPAIGTSLDIDRVHWEHDDLQGMLSMRCELPGARTVFGNTLSVATFNISGPNGRKNRAEFLAKRTSAPNYDWEGLMEEFCQRILADQCEAPKAERLADIPRTTDADRWIDVAGMKLLVEHPTVFFGDGGSAKSYIALYLGGLIARSGVNVALFDWELAGGDHRDRYERALWRGYAPQSVVPEARVPSLKMPGWAAKVCQGQRDPLRNL